MSALVPQGMALSEFVTETLLEIASGIREAEERFVTERAGVRVNPESKPGTVEFDVALSPTGPRLAADDRGATRVRFTISLSLPAGRGPLRPPERAERPWMP